MIVLAILDAKPMPISRAHLSSTATWSDGSHLAKHAGRVTEL